METSTNLYRITSKDAQHLMMAPAVAGGFCAVARTVCGVVEEICCPNWGDDMADVLAHLPPDMFDKYKTNPVDVETAQKLANGLRNVRDDEGEPMSACVDISDRIYAILAAL